MARGKFMTGSEHVKDNRLVSTSVTIVVVMSQAKRSLSPQDEMSTPRSQGSHPGGANQAFVDSKVSFQVFLTS